NSMSRRTRARLVAGVMGLQNSEVRPDTTEIILEVANFERTRIRATSKALGLRTESAIRFEKGLDPEGVPAAALRFVKLLADLCPSVEVEYRPADVRPEPAPARRIDLVRGWVARRLGTSLSDAREEAILRRLGFGTEREREHLAVTVPSWRATDVSIPEDLVEEVGRIHGYEKINPLPLVGNLEPVPEEPERAARRRLRETLSGRCGLTEIHTYPFTTEEACRRSAVAPGTIAVTNAGVPGLDLLSPSHVPSLLRAVGHNLKYREMVAVYVVAPVFAKGEKGKLPREEERVGFAVAGDGGAAALEAKGIVEALLDTFHVDAGVRQEAGPGWLHPGRSARVVRGRRELGWFGQLHPRVGAAFEIETPVGIGELDTAALRDAEHGEVRMKAISRFPGVRFDVAVVVDRRTPAADVQQALGRSGGELTRSVRLFDVYEGGNLALGKRSLAFRLEFSAADRTLEPRDVERLRGAVQRAVERAGWTIRA
ncbi:MAG: phenylalanine--tRNA ligase subunit beta, partial [Planctomycetota bacterium]